jgi:pimeloyl-ACP methyl ester carboxylesterase
VPRAKESNSVVYRSKRGRDAVLAAYEEQRRRVPFPIESRYVDTGAGATHVVTAGSVGDRPLVVLSGVNFGAFFTTEWVAQLAPHFRLIIPDIVGQPNLSAETRPDLRSHGYARWLLDVLDGLGLGTVHMMGVSFGGGVVLDVAATAPERIDRAALLVPGGFAGGNPLGILLRLFLPWTLYRLIPRPARIGAILSPLADDLPPHWQAFFDLLLRHVHWAVRPPGPFGADELAGFGSPTLALFARHDCFFPGEQAARATREALRDRVTTRVIPGKHIPAATQLDAIQRTVLDFFGKSRPISPATRETNTGWSSTR